MSSHKPCTRKLLARSRSCTVDLCSCGSVHLTAGPCTLRMTRDAFEEFGVAIAAALRTRDLQCADVPWPDLAATGNPGALS